MGAVAGPKAITLAELQGQSPGVDARSSWGSPMAAPGSQVDNDTMGTAGKIKLPSFVDAMGIQAAYLQYEGKDGSSDLVPNGNSADNAQLVAALPSSQNYPKPSTSAPQRCEPRRPARPYNPQLQTWQEDPFSQWR